MGDDVGNNVRARDPSFDSLIGKLKEAIGRLDYADVNDIQALVREGLIVGRLRPDKDQCRDLLRTFRGSRLFFDAIEMAETLLRCGHGHVIVRRELAQSLIDTGSAGVALDVLQRLEAVPDLDIVDRGEVLGLIGRAHKQIYVDAARGTPASRHHDALLTSILRYAEAYKVDPETNHWHAINLVAILARAARDGIIPADDPAAASMARSIIAKWEVEASRSDLSDHWLLATLGEANFALGDYPAAEHWYGRFTQHANSFEIASAVRQLRELWQVSHGSGPQGQILRALESYLLEMRNGSLDLSLRDSKEIRSAATDDGLVTETILGKDAPMKLQWLKNGVRCASSVVRVRDNYKDVTVGTGFVVDPREFGLAEDRLYVLTNEHVIRRIGRRDIQIQPIDDPDTLLPCGEPVWTSSEEILDAALVPIKAPSSVLKPLAIAEPDRLPDDYVQSGGIKLPCYVIGLSASDEAVLSLSDAELLETGRKERAATDDHVFLRYKTPTESGTSGSPVFDHAWKVVGLHRAGLRVGVSVAGKQAYVPVRRLGGREGTMLANEGVALKSIIAAARRELSARAPSRSPHVLAPETAAAEGMPSRITMRELQRRIEDPSMPESAILPYLMVDETRDHGFDRHLIPNEALIVPEPVSAAEEDSAGEGQPEFMGDAANVLVIGSANMFLSGRRRSRFTDKRKNAPHHPVILAKGDSWFQFPEGRKVWRSIDVLEHLLDEFAVKSFSTAGATLQRLLTESDLVQAVAKDQPQVILLSGGGNDLLGHGYLETFLRRGATGSNADAYLADATTPKLQELRAHYNAFLDSLTKVAKGVPIICYGYAYALPRPNAGPWLHGPMSAVRITDPPIQAAVIRALIDRFHAEVMVPLTSHTSGQVHLVDCRRAVGGSERWYDELHPNRDGFASVATLFRLKINDLLGR